MDKVEKPIKIPINNYVSEVFLDYEQNFFGLVRIKKSIKKAWEK